MSILAIAVKHLISAGVSGDALVQAIAEMEEAAQPERTKGAERTARWRERHKASQSVTCDVKKEIPHTPLEKTTPHLEPTSAREAEGKASVSRGTRLPIDFAPLPNIVQLGINLGFSEADLSDQLERFRDWANAATGQVSIKRDWQAAFRNWIKRAADDRKKPSNRQTAGQSLRDAFDRQRQHLAENFGGTERGFQRPTGEGH